MTAKNATKVTARTTIPVWNAVARPKKTAMAPMEMAQMVMVARIDAPLTNHRWEDRIKAATFSKPEVNNNKAYRYMLTRDKCCPLFFIFAITAAKKQIATDTKQQPTIIAGHSQALWAETGTENITTVAHITNKAKVTRIIFNESLFMIGSSLNFKKSPRLVR